jgi:hypothetical protein
MKPEILDSLVMDRALGELPPEVIELLEAHLGQNPALAQRAGELAGALQSVRHAIMVVPGSILPPLDTQRMCRAAPPSGARGWLREWTRLAACLAAGAALGWSVRASRPTRDDAAEANSVAGSRRAVSGDYTGPASATAGFWNVQALVIARAQDQPAPHYRLHWTSPLAKPTLEETP